MLSPSHKDGMRKPRNWSRTQRGSGDGSVEGPPCPQGEGLPSRPHGYAPTAGSPRRLARRLEAVDAAPRVNVSCLFHPQTSPPHKWMDRDLPVS